MPTKAASICFWTAFACGMIGMFFLPLNEFIAAPAITLGLILYGISTRLG